MLSERIKLERTKKDLSQMSLSKILGVSQQTIGSWETGRTSPDPDMIKNLADFFNVTTDYLLGNDAPSSLAANQPSKKDLRDLDKFLTQTEIMFDGDTYQLNDADREKVRAALKLAFWDAKESNKRKKD